MKTILAAMCSLLAANVAEAECRLDAKQRDRLQSFELMVGSARAKLKLVIRSDDSIEGVYAYATSTEDIVLKGKIEDHERIVLTEFLDGQPHATFEGSFPSKRPGWGTSFENNCAFASGAWWLAKGGQQLPFNMTTSGSGPGKLGRLYLVANVEDDEVVNRSAMAFRRAVIAHEPEKVADLARFPLRARVRVGGEEISIKSRAEFLANYDAIFYPEYVALIRADIPRVMMATSQGVAFTHGIVWFDAEGRLVTLNN